MRLLTPAILSSFLLASSPAAAQVAGTVLDVSGAPVAGARVTAAAAAATTGDDGRFVLPQEPAPGTAVVATAPGFAPATVPFSAGAELRLVLRPAPFVENVAVTAARGDARLATAAASTIVASAELLTSAAGTLDDALRATPGFSLFRRSSSRVANPTTQGVTLRGVSGSGASRTLVLADGLPLNDPFGSWVYWNRVPLAAIDRVEVVRGGTGDLYGADALGGVIQVLTLSPGRTRLRAIGEGGSHDTSRLSAFGGTSREAWSLEASGEWLRTDGILTVAEESRGPVDVQADSDYTTGFVGGGFNPGPWHASGRLSLYDEERGNGTPLQVNATDWMQAAGSGGGAAGGGAWLARASAGTQEYYQTFTAVAGDRASERLTTEQTTPSTFWTASGQWTRGWDTHVWLVGGEGRRTRSTVESIRYSFAGVPAAPSEDGGTEASGALFSRVSVSPADALTLVIGMRADFWQSTPHDAALPAHSAEFFSPRVSAAWTLSDAASLHVSAYRAHRTPTLNELHRGFRVGDIVTNPNPRLDPERLTGVEAGVLASRGRASARLTAFWNQLDDAIANVTIAATPALITRQRQNTDTVRAAGLELEADVRPAPGWTIGALAVLTRSTFASAPGQPAIEGNRVPQVPSYELGASATWAGAGGFTGSLQARAVGAQYDDDRNAFELGAFGVVDAYAGQEIRRGLHVFAAAENLFDADYDVGRTPIRTVGWPRTIRMGVRVFMP